MANKKLTAFILGKQSGYDKKSRRWRTADGTIVKKNSSVVMAGSIPDDGFPTKSFPVFGSRTPISDTISNYFDIQRKSLGLNSLLSSFVDDSSEMNKAMPIPSNIRAAMALSEFYCSTQGDVYQHIEAPIDIAMGSDIVIDCPDLGVKHELELLYSPEYYDMWNTLYQSWLSCSIYGIACPLEVHEEKKIVMLPPRYVWIGYYVNYGVTPQTTPSNPSPYGLKPPDGYDYWTEELVETALMPMSYNTFGAYANEQILKAWGLPLSPEFMHPIRAKGMAWQRYPMPPLSRAFNSISSRVVLQEATRSTIEGIKNQIWAVHLGDKDYRPTPKEVKAFTSMMMQMSADRAGTIIWTDPYKIETHGPTNVDMLLANDTMQHFSMAIFRDLGANLRLVSGNGPLGGRGDGTSIEVDLSVWLRRMEFPRLQLLRWEREFRKRMVERNGSPAMKKANELTTVRFSKSLLEVSELIEKELMPLYQIGSLSHRTFLERSGYNYEQEVNRKKQEATDEPLFQPKSTFAQTTVNPDTPEKTAESTPTGKREAEEPEDV